MGFTTLNLKLAYDGKSMFDNLTPFSKHDNFKPQKYLDDFVKMLSNSRFSQFNMNFMHMNSIHSPSYVKIAWMSSIKLACELILYKEWQFDITNLVFQEHILCVHYNQLVENVHQLHAKYCNNQLLIFIYFWINIFVPILCHITCIYNQLIPNTKPWTILNSFASPSTLPNLKVGHKSSFKTLVFDSTTLFWTQWFRALHLIITSSS